MVDFKQHSREFTRLRREQAKLRKGASGTLTPEDIRRAIKKGEVPPSWEALAITNENGDPFTVDDLKRMQKSQEKASKAFKGMEEQGVPPSQLISSSLQIDIDRANGNAPTGSLPRGPARLYKMVGNTAFFSVKASQESNASQHQVRIRLHGWGSQLLNMRANPVTAAKNAVEKGNISIDCDCGRHQFWYRYLAGVGQYAIEPPAEKDFPAKRNPKLKGACCKHVIKTIMTIKTPAVISVLSNQMKLQRKRSGFAEGDKKERFIGKKELEKLSRGKPRKADVEQAKKNLKKFKQAQQAFRKATQNKKIQKDIEKELSKLTPKGVSKSTIQKAAKAIANPNAALKAKLQLDIDSYKKLGIPITNDQVAKVFAKREGVSEKKVNTLINELGDKS